MKSTAFPLSLPTALLVLNALAAGPAADTAKAPASTAPKAAFTVTTDRPDGIYRQGETITFLIQMTENGHPVAGRKLDYSLEGDGHFSQKGQLASAAEPVKVTAKLDRPGWIHLKVTGTDADDKPIPWWNLTGIAGAAVDPFQVKAGQTMPADFDAFWAEQKAKLAREPQNLIEIPGTLKQGSNEFRTLTVKIDTEPGLRPLIASVTIPQQAAPKSLPARLSFPGAGVRSASFGPMADTITLNMNVHGIEDRQPADFYLKFRNGDLKDYPHSGAESRDSYYYRGVFLRILRALEYVKSRPEWDGKHLMVAGGSQGGGLALVAAGLDPAVTQCKAGMPALCDHLGYTRDQFSGWPQLADPDPKTKKNANPEIAKTSGYYDAALFASRIKAETEVSIGLRDTTCPPTSVFAAFNNLPVSNKTLWIYPEAGHSLTGRKFELKPGPL